MESWISMVRPGKTIDAITRIFFKAQLEKIAPLSLSTKLHIHCSFIDLAIQN